MNKVYIVFRGCTEVGDDDDIKEIESVHADIISAREAVEEILTMLAKEGFIYTVPADSSVRMWRHGKHFISIEEHPVQSSAGK